MDLMEMRMRQQPHHWGADLLPERRIDVPVLPPVNSQAGWRQNRNKRNHHNHIKGYEMFNPNTNSKLENAQMKMLSQLPWSYADAVKKPNNKQANQPLSKDEDEIKEQSTKPTVEVNGENAHEEETNADWFLNPDASEFVPVATSSDKDEMTVSATTTTDNENEEISETLEENQLKQQLSEDILDINIISDENGSEIKINDEEINGNIQTDDGYMNKLDEEDGEVKESNLTPEESSFDISEELIYKKNLDELDETVKNNDPFSPCVQNSTHQDKTELNAFGHEEHSFGDNFTTSSINKQINNENQDNFHFESTEKTNHIGNDLNFDELVKNKVNYSEAHVGENEVEVNLINSLDDNVGKLENRVEDNYVYENKEINEINGSFVELDNLNELNKHPEEVNATTETSVDDQEENLLNSSTEETEIQTNDYIKETNCDNVEMNESDGLLDSERLFIREDKDENEDTVKSGEIGSKTSLSETSDQIINSCSFTEENLFDKSLNQHNNQENDDKSQLDSQEQSELFDDLKEEEETLKKIEAELENCKETLNIDELNYLNKLDIDENFFSDEILTDTFEEEGKISDGNNENNLTEIANDQNDTEVTKTEEQLSPEAPVNTYDENDDKENVFTEGLYSNNHHFDENKNTEAENLQDENILLDTMTTSRDETNDNDSSFEIINDCSENNDQDQEQSQCIQDNLSNGNIEICEPENTLYECINPKLLLNDRINDENFSVVPENNDETDCEEDNENSIKTSSECDASASQSELDQQEDRLPLSHDDTHLINSSEEITPVEESIESELTLKEKAYKLLQEENVPSENSDERLVLMNVEHILLDQKFYEDENINMASPKSENICVSNDIIEINNIIESNNTEVMVESNTFGEDVILESKESQNNGYSYVLENEKVAKEICYQELDNCEPSPTVRDEICNEDLEICEPIPTVKEEIGNEELDNCEPSPTVRDEICNEELEIYEPIPTLKEEICNEELDNCEPIPTVKEEIYNEESDNCDPSATLEEEISNEELVKFESEILVEEGTCNEEIENCKSGLIEEEQVFHNELYEHESSPLVEEETPNKELDECESYPLLEKKIYNDGFNKCESGFLDEEEVSNKVLENHESLHLDEGSSSDKIKELTDKPQENRETNLSNDVPLKFATDDTFEDSCQSTDLAIEETSLNEEEQMVDKVHTEEEVSFEKVYEINKGEEKLEEIMENQRHTDMPCESQENKEENEFINLDAQDNKTEILTTETEIIEPEHFKSNRNDMLEEKEEIVTVNSSQCQDFDESPEESKPEDEVINHNREENPVFSSTLIEGSPEMIKLETNEISTPDDIQTLDSATINDSETAVSIKPDDTIPEFTQTSLTAAAAITSVAVGAAVLHGITVAEKDSNDSDIKLENEIFNGTEEDKKSHSTLKSSSKKTISQVSSPNKPSSPVSSKPKVAVGKTTSTALKSSTTINNTQSKSSSSVIKSQSVSKSTAAQAKTLTASKPAAPNSKPTGQLASSTKSAGSPIKVASASKTSVSKPAPVTAKGLTSKPATSASTKQAASLTKPTTPSNKTSTSLAKSSVPAKPSASAPAKPAVGIGAKPVKTQTATSLSKPAETMVSKNIPSKPGTPTSKSSTPATKSTTPSKPSATKPSSAAVKLSSSAKTVATKPSSPTTKASPIPAKASISTVAKATPTKSSGEVSKISKTNASKPSTPPSKSTPTKPTSATSKTPLVIKKPGSPIKQSTVSSSVAKSSSVSENNGIVKNNLKTAVNSPATKPIQKIGSPTKNGVAKPGAGTTDKAKVTQTKTPSNSAKKSPNPIKKLTAEDKNVKNVNKSPTPQKKTQAGMKEEEAVTSTTEDFPIENNFVIDDLPPQISV